MKAIIFTSITLSYLVLPAMSAAEGVANKYWGRVFGGVWLAQAEGEFSGEASGIPGDTFDYDDFGLDDFEPTIMLEGSVSVPLFMDFHAGIFSYSSDGENNFSAPVDFLGSTFNGETTTDMSFVDIYGEVAWRPINFDVVGGSIGLALHWIDGEVEMTENSSSTTENAAESFPIPAVSGRVYANPINELSLEGRMHLMSIEVGDVDATFYDILLTVAYRPIDWLGVVGGYRYVLYDLEYDVDDEFAKIDLTLSGPFLGVMAVF